MTFRVTVFEVALPFFGVTVTVTLQEPVLRPLRAAPETLQNFAELATTFIETFEVENIGRLAYLAIAFAEVNSVVTTAKVDGIDEETGVGRLIIGAVDPTVTAVVLVVEVDVVDVVESGGGLPRARRKFDNWCLPS